jgi:4-hydroxy-3-methylbut-2-enyl diphosphate reductase
VIAAGAGAPESVAQDCETWTKKRYVATVEERTIRAEDVSFPLPKELRGAVQLPMA